MRRRLKTLPAEQTEESAAELEIFDLDVMSLSELSGQEEQDSPGQQEPQEQQEPERQSRTPTVEELEAELEKTRHRSQYWRVLRSTCFSLLVVAAVAVLIAVLLLPVLRIAGTSMTETLQDRDIVVALNSSEFDTGDVIAFYYNNSILVKRVIATAGDWVDIDEEGDVYVNGELVEEPYIKEKALGQCDIELPCQVPDNRCFVMGDHRATSIDSRNTAVGCINVESVVGRIVFRIWPLHEVGMIN